MEQERVPRQKQESVEQHDFKPNQGKLASLPPPPFQLKASNWLEEGNIQLKQQATRIIESPRRDVNSEPFSIENYNHPIQQKKGTKSSFSSFSLVAQQQSGFSNLNVIQRDEDDNIKTGLDKSMLNVTSTPAVQKGALSVSNKTLQTTDDGVHVQSPMIEASASFKLKDDIKLGKENPLIYVGPIQTLMSSSRIGVYKKNGKVVAEEVQKTEEIRDASLGGTRQNPIKPPKPFYFGLNGYTPGRLSENNRIIDNYKFMDRPGFALYKKFADGQLSAVKGRDVFNTSWGAKREDTVLTFNPFTWEVDWNVDLDQSYSMIGKPSDLQIADARTAVIKDTEEIALDKGVTKYISVYHTIDAAMTQSAAKLWSDLLPSRNYDASKAVNIEEALRQKNPSFEVSITAENIVNAFSDDLDTFFTILPKPKIILLTLKKAKLR